MGSFIDITGQQFHDWTAIEYVGNRMWLVRCRCGFERLVPGRNLRNGTESKSCTRCSVKRRKPPKQKNIVKVGQRFGKLEILNVWHEKTKRGFVWKVKAYCDCGVVKTIRKSDLFDSNGRSGTASCGNCSLDTNKKTKGYSNHPVYRNVENIISRCYRPSTGDFHVWGGRGIRVWDPFYKNRELFLFYLELVAMSTLPRKIAIKLITEGGWAAGRRSPDRIDTDSHYQPLNIGWATPREQAMNKREGPVKPLMGPPNLKAWIF